MGLHRHLPTFKHLPVLTPLLPLVLTLPAACAQQQVWLTQFGSSGGESAYGIASDGAGGAMVVGRTYGDMGGPSAGTYDAYVARYSGSGDQIWIRQFGTSEFDRASRVAADGSGGVFVSGSTEGSLGGPNAGPMYTHDAFLARYDTAGNQRWLIQFGTSEEDSMADLAPDGAGGVLVAGTTGGALAGPYIGGFRDGFLAQYDSAGNQLWIKQIGTSGTDYIDRLYPDGAGGFFLVGSTGGDFGGPNAGSHDAFLARYDGHGDQVWVRQFGSSEADSLRGVVSDGAGGVLVAGWTDGDLVGTSAGKEDIYVACFDGEGIELWSRQFGSTESDRAWCITSDGAGGAVIGGRTKGDLAGPVPKHYAAFMARFDSEGNRLWVRQFGTGKSDGVFGMMPDGTGGVMLAGETSGNLGGPNSSLGASDAWIARFAIDFCYADCDSSTVIGTLDVFDFLCFQNSFVSGELYACDCDTTTGNGVCDIFDFVCFQDAFVAGCP